MARLKKYESHTLIFMYDDEYIKSITDPEMIPQIGDSAVINSWRYEVFDHVVDMDENKIFIFLE